MQTSIWQRIMNWAQRREKQEKSLNAAAKKHENICKLCARIKGRRHAVAFNATGLHDRRNALKGLACRRNKIVSAAGGSRLARREVMRGAA